ncbi:MAG: GMC oxidoreductase [Vicinamibacterales bacterium]
MPDFDAIVIGSGFGGAVCALRLAQAGARVLILERGRRWAVEDYPRAIDDPWVWDDHRPEQRHGWFDFRVFPNMSVVQGAGVGGGSLVYANISVDAKPDTFRSGWPPEITFERLQDHYATVGRMLGVSPVPTGQWPERTRLLKEAAERAGYGHRFRRLDLAVNFDPDYRPDLPNARDPRHSRMAPNEFGVEQGTCVHLGTCDIGCTVKARNTLDFNYLALAEGRHRAEIRPLHIVRRIKTAAGGGYDVHYDEIAGGALRPGQAAGRIVVLAAGSLGSTEILLRSRAGGFLPNVSARLGEAWSSNGDFLTPALHFPRSVKPTVGPTITAAIDLLDGEFEGRPMFIEDGGLPDAGVEYLQRLGVEDEPDDPRMQRVVATIRTLLWSGRLFEHVMPWFAQARDAADGRLSLKNDRLFLDWDIDASEPTMNAVASLHRTLAFLTGGIPITSPAWTIGRDLITPHPLGGCNMGVSASNGVVDHAGQVFNCPGLYVADGAIVPKAIGLNPSKTIAALAEHIATGLVANL